MYERPGGALSGTPYCSHASPFQIGQVTSVRLGRTYEVRHVWEVCKHHFSEDVSWRGPCHVHILSSVDDIGRS